MKKIKVAVIGTVGVPAKYGGFETLVENIIGNNCSQGIEYTVYCSSKSYKQRLNEYKGAKLKYVQLKANGAESIPYDIISILRSLRHYEVLLILGVSGAIVLPFVKWICKGKIIINIDGLEHRRDKWSPKIRKFLKFSEKIAVRNADIVIADNKAIQDYVRDEYNVKSELIAYGGDHVQCDVSQIQANVLLHYKITPNEYSFSLCRIEPENNVHITLEAFAKSRKKLLFVGNWNNSEYGKYLLEKYRSHKNIEMIASVYDLPTLNVLRSNCIFYIHGHSAGGTNPSLVEAMFFGVPIIAFDCEYNRESTGNQANYFKNATQLTNLLDKPIGEFKENAQSMAEIAKQRYRWANIASQYENLY